jgi:hypothetical protein
MKYKFQILISAFLLSFLLYFAGCGKKKDVIDDAPKTLIEEREMVDILADMQLVEAIYRKSQFAEYDSLEIQVYYSRIFEKHNIDQAKFNASFDYYEKSPRKIERIYAQVIEKLSAMEEDVKSKE